MISSSLRTLRLALQHTFELAFNFQFLGFRLAGDSRDIPISLSVGHVVPSYVNLLALAGAEVIVHIFIIDYIEYIVN